MVEIIRLAVGIVVLFLGIPLGNFLANQTIEELKDGKKWFKLIILFSTLVSIFGLVTRNDFVLFGFLFIAIVTSRSLVKQ